MEVNGHGELKLLQQDNGTGRGSEGEESEGDGSEEAVKGSNVPSGDAAASDPCQGALLCGDNEQMAGQGRTECKPLQLTNGTGKSSEGEDSEGEANEKVTNGPSIPISVAGASASSQALLNCTKNENEQITEQTEFKKVCLENGTEKSKDGVREDSESSEGEGSGEEATNGSSVVAAVATASDSCQALLLCQDYNEQMTAAKKFLKMVRDGINENGKTTTVASSPLKSGDSSTDEDATISTNNNKLTVLSNNTAVSNNNNTKSSSAIATKEKVGVNGVSTSSARAAIGSSKLPINIPILAAALNQHSLESDQAPTCVQEVWAHNLLEEFAKIRRVVKQFTFVAMDTEFPGIVVRPQCAVRGAGVFPYELLKVNVDRLKIIQLGLTFMDKDGKCPPGVCTWQFNFKFSLNKDLYASDSISLLARCGIQFERHAEMGIEPEMFGEYFMSSGMVTSDKVTYLTFHSGFDFGYLIKLLSNLPLPENEEKFFEIMKIYFPNVYDLKFLMKSVDLHGGLQDIANQMGQERVGTQHQAGSDSLLTGMTFFKLLSTDVFKGEIDQAKYCGKLYGFHLNEDGTKDEGWSEIAGDNLLDATSPKPPPPTSRTSNSNGTTSNSLLPTTQSTQQQHPSSSSAGNSTDTR